MQIDRYKTWTLAELVQEIGPSLTAVGCGLDEIETLNAWLAGAQIPEDHHRKVLLLGRCCGVLSQRLTSEQIQRWLLANNPDLAEDPAIFALAQGRGVAAVKSAQKFAT